MVCRAAVAQLVEQRIRNAKVASSTPASGTSNKKDLARLMRFGFFLQDFMEALYWFYGAVGCQALPM